MAPSGHRRNLQTKSSSEIFSRNFHPCRTGDSSTGDSLYKFGRTNTAVFGINNILQLDNRWVIMPGLLLPGVYGERFFVSICYPCNIFGFGTDKKRVVKGLHIIHGTEAETQLPLKRSSRFQRLFPNPSWLVEGHPATKNLLQLSQG